MNINIYYIYFFPFISSYNPYSSIDTDFIKLGLLVSNIESLDVLTLKFKYYFYYFFQALFHKKIKISSNTKISSNGMV